MSMPCRLTAISAILRQLPGAAALFATCLFASGCDRTRLLDNQYGNTLHYKAIDTPLEMWFWTDPDGTYRGWASGIPGRTGFDQFSGTWRVRDGQSCRQQRAPPPPPDGGYYCEPLRHYVLGQEVPSSDGRFRVRLERGRRPPSSR